MEKIKKQVLIWLRRFSTCCFLDNSGFAGAADGYECLAAAGETARVALESGTAFRELRRFSDLQDDWLFGHFSFSLKAETEAVAERLSPGVVFPDLFFFVPQIVITIENSECRIGCLAAEETDAVSRASSVYGEIAHAEDAPGEAGKPVQMKERMNKEEYLDAVRRLLVHIQRGDCYEINFCQEFYAEDARIDPFTVFAALSAGSPAPFAAFYRVGDRYLLCASPERYLRRKGDRVYSQPIKGTSARYPDDPQKDLQSKATLAASRKDQTENVMITDLVRNDLSRFCLPDSVRVDELFGIYSFAQVHQMISTVSGTVAPGTDWTDMIRASFPMGSMTGAPKKRVLELIAEYERSARGLFSGALGYVAPGRDFDFNVVIRSLLYDAAGRRMSWFAGSGITAGSDPESEYEECLVKVSAIRKVLSGK